MRRIILAGVLPLAACVSPLDSCISRAYSEIRVMDGLIATTERNIARGYALETEEYFVNEWQACGESGGEPVYCEIPVAQTRQVPVAIDLDDEAKKLDTLKRKRAQMAAQAEYTVEECRIKYPPEA